MLCNNNLRKYKHLFLSLMILQVDWGLMGSPQSLVQVCSMWPVATPNMFFSKQMGRSTDVHAKLNKYTKAPVKQGIYFICLHFIS